MTGVDAGRAGAGPEDRPHRTLVVAATRVEAAHVPAGLPVLVTGIGKVAAATETTLAVGRLLADGVQVEVVNIGTAGALRGGLAGLFLPSTVVNADLSADALRALGVEVDDVLDVPGGDGTALATGDTFVSDRVVRDALAARAHLVDMEGFAVAWACRRLGVPVRLVKHVSDAADDSALRWLDVVDASARVLGAWLAEHVTA